MTAATPLYLAPELQVSAWLNTSEPLTLSSLKGKVVIICAFQMLCPGCVSHALPQANTIHTLFAEDDVQVIGLHTVFEHHEVMSTAALTAFSSEYRIQFPIAVDRPSTSGPVPRTMANYGMSGTPTLIVIDRKGRIRLKHFGLLADMQVGSVIGGLLAEVESGTAAEKPMDSRVDSTSPNCDGNGCVI
jgi:peroxiredoxin